MKIRRILVVCQGNICRSPAAAALLARALPDHEISSAGLGALVDSDMDETMRAVAAEKELECPVHRGRMFSPELARESDLILVMERSQREQIARKHPEFSGKVMLMGQWIGERDIVDPHRRSRKEYEQAFALLEEASHAWAGKLAGE